VSVEQRAYPISIPAMARPYRLSYLHQALKRTGLTGISTAHVPGDADVSVGVPGCSGGRSLPRHAHRFRTCRFGLLGRDDSSVGGGDADEDDAFADDSRGVDGASDRDGEDRGENRDEVEKRARAAEREDGQGAVSQHVGQH